MNERKINEIHKLNNLLQNDLEYYEDLKEIYIGIYSNINEIIVGGIYNVA